MGVGVGVGVGVGLGVGVGVGVGVVGVGVGVGVGGRRRRGGRGRRGGWGRRGSWCRRWRWGGRGSGSRRWGRCRCRDGGRCWRGRGYGGGYDGRRQIPIVAAIAGFFDELVLIGARLDGLTQSEFVLVPAVGLGHENAARQRAGPVGIVNQELVRTGRVAVDGQEIGGGTVAAEKGVERDRSGARSDEIPVDSQRIASEPVVHRELARVVEGRDVEDRACDGACAGVGGDDCAGGAVGDRVRPAEVLCAAGAVPGSGPPGPAVVKGVRTHVDELDRTSERAVVVDGCHTALGLDGEGVRGARKILDGPAIVGDAYRLGP